MKITCSLLIFVLLLFSFSAQSQAKAASPVSGPLTPKQAVEVIQALPEIKAWTKFIEDKTGRTARAALVVEPEFPQVIEKMKYWSVAFFENQGTRAHRWQTFLVRLDGKAILVYHTTSGEIFSLRKWRQEEKPMERIRESKAR